MTPEVQGRIEIGVEATPPFTRAVSPAPDRIIQHLISTEAHVHYNEAPPPGVQPFVAVARDSRILLSAPHGSRCFRNNGSEVWHEEDEYTAGIALLLSERCNTSVIANIWRSDMCDPNWHDEPLCPYKARLRELVQQNGVRWLLDLHGAAEDNRRLGNCKVDLGTRNTDNSLDVPHRDKLRSYIEARIGARTVSLNQFPASTAGTVTSFCQRELHIQAVQIEMKPSVRVPFRRVDASSYATKGPYSAPAETVIAMLSALEDFVAYLKRLPTP